MNKLCIVLHSIYPQKKSSMDIRKQEEIEHFTEETRLDAATIHETFSEASGFSIIDINIDIQLKDENKIKKLVESSLKYGLDDIEECLVVINSHGSTINKDMQDFAVKAVVELVTNANIPIRHISALICHAMAKQTAKEAADRLKAHGMFSHAAADGTVMPSVKKLTTMQILRDKLNKMELNRSQSFNIYGPDRAYLPSEYEFVKQILRGDTSIPEIKALPVTIKPKVLDIEKIKAAIDFVEFYMSDKPAHSADASKRIQFQAMTNLLGPILMQMANKLFDYLPQTSSASAGAGSGAGAGFALDIPEPLQELYEAISAYDEPRSWEDKFNTWKNAHKFSDEDGERLKIIKNYIRFLMPGEAVSVGFTEPSDKPGSSADLGTESGSTPGEGPG